MDPQYCSKCMEYPQDILMLACNHDLCLECAADRFIAATKIRHSPTVYFFQKMITCQICGTATQLDRASIIELEKIAPLVDKINQKKPKKQNRIEIDKYQKILSPQTNIRRVQSPKESLVGYRPSRRHCSQHTQQEISYFCFTCLSQCICPQCVIHGVHKDHQVITVKRANNQIKERLQNIKAFIDQHIASLSIVKQNYSKEIRTVNQNNIHIKKQISKVFQQLKNKLIDKQHEILRKCDKVTEIVVSQYQITIQKVIKQIEELKQSNYLISDSLKSDQVKLFLKISVLNFYSNKHSFLESFKQKPSPCVPGKQSEKKIITDNTYRIIQKIQQQITSLDIQPKIQIPASVRQKTAYKRQEQSFQYNNRRKQKNW